MAERTPEEWQELIDKLEAVAYNSKEPRERRAKAQAILDSIEQSPYRKGTRPAGRGSTMAKVMTDLEYDGTIV